MGERAAERLTVDEAAARAGTTPDRLRHALLAAGLALDPAQERPLTEDDVESAVVFELGAALLGDAGALAFTRLLGNAAARVAEAAVEQFADEIEAHAGPSPLDHARATAEAVAALDLVPSAFARLLHQHVHQAVRRSLLERIGDQPSTVHTTIGFVDLVGSTAWTRERSTEELAHALVQFESAAFDIATAHGGWIVKLIGDAAMFEAPDPLAACHIGLDLCAAVDACADLPGARGGLACGPVQARDGDYFGTVVNLAARAAAVSEPSRLAVNEAVAEHVRAAGPDGWSVEDMPPHPLRGFDDPPALFRLSRT